MTAPTWEEWCAATYVRPGHVSERTVREAERILRDARARLHARELARAAGERWPKVAA